MFTGTTRYNEGGEHIAAGPVGAWFRREWEGRTAGREEVHASLKEMQTRASVRVESEVEAKSTKEAVLDKTYMLVARVLTTEENEAVGDPGVDHYEHPANKIGLEDYAKELAFLPDFTEDSNTTINYEAPNVKN
ncbi:hypothetical protein L917_21680 [Phytophthora nicotianae]|uniref:Uncharacterized protein n=1 Tax=Phytophthora nicotianae TaxID=4792 RepID=W2JYW7_PHYNI|nr:hypothetical protein L917_21680 [Phytophthora nicotianae]